MSIIKEETVDGVNYRINILYGVKELKPDVWKIRRIKGKRSWLNWYPKDQAEVTMEFISMTGDYDELLEAAALSGAKLEFIE